MNDNNDNNDNIPSAPNYEDKIDNGYTDELTQLPDFGSTMNIRLHRSIDFLTEENKYFRDKIT